MVTNMANTFNYDNLRLEDIGNRLQEADAADLLQSAVNDKHAIKVDEDSYYLWNADQNEFYGVIRYSDGTYAHDSTDYMMRSQLEDVYEEQNKNEIARLQSMKQDLKGWDRFVDFFGLKTDRIRHNDRIDKAIKMKVDAYVRDRMTKAGITNEKVLPPAAKAADKALPGLNWGELKQYVQSGQIPAKQGQSKAGAKGNETPKDVKDKFDFNAKKRALAKTLLDSLHTDGAKRLEGLIDTEQAATEKVVDMLSAFQMHIDPPKDSKIPRMSVQKAAALTGMIRTFCGQIPEDDTAKAFVQNYEKKFPTLANEHKKLRSGPQGPGFGGINV